MLDILQASLTYFWSSCRFLSERRPLQNHCLSAYSSSAVVVSHPRSSSFMAGTLEEKKRAVYFRQHSKALKRNRFVSAHLHSGCKCVVFLLGTYVKPSREFSPFSPLQHSGWFDGGIGSGCTNRQKIRNVIFDMCFLYHSKMVKRGVFEESTVYVRLHDSVHVLVCPCPRFPFSFVKNFVMAITHKRFLFWFLAAL